ncbi:MAG: hypothetical protein C4300_01435 [Thermus sp.]
MPRETVARLRRIPGLREGLAQVVEKGGQPEGQGGPWVEPEEVEKDGEAMDRWLSRRDLA